MLFANSVMLWGLLAVSVPIIIHLFNLQRYKKVYFTNVRFLQQLQQQSRRQSVLRHWLALLFRILVIISLVLAFARPYIPSPLSVVSESPALASIYLDNSFSMESEGSNGILFDDGVKKATEIISGHSNSDKFNLLTNDFQAIHHRLVSADEFGTLVQDVEISPAVRNLTAVLGRQYDILGSEVAEYKSVYLISDFQRNISSFEGFMPDSSIHHYMVHMKPVNQSNISIDTCWFDTPAQQPGQIIDLHVKLTNHGSVAVENIPVRLIVNGTQRALASFSLGRNESATGSFRFSIRETGIHHGFIELNDFPVTFDDKLYLSFEVRSSINVMSIYEQQPGPYLRALFGPDTLFNFTETSFRRLDFSEIHRQQLVILNGLQRFSSGLTTELERFLENGGSLFIIPSSEHDLDSYRSWMRSINTVGFSDSDTMRIRVDDLNLLHPVYKDVFETGPDGMAQLGQDVDLPWVSHRFRFTYPPRKDVQTLIRLRNGEAFLVADRFGEGQIYILASALDIKSGTFPVHAIFVPTLYKMALNSVQQQSLYYLVGTQESVNIGSRTPGNEAVFRMVSADGRMKFIPGHRTVNYNTHLFALDAIKSAGNYFLIAGSDTLTAVSFNYDRRESVPDYLSVQELYDMAERTGFTNFAVISESERPLGQVISELNRGRQLWKYFILAALVFLLAEIFALRLLH